jgi:hypothetical protein
MRAVLQHDFDMLQSHRLNALKSKWRAEEGEA